MKEGLHPKWYPDAKVFVAGEEVMTVGSTIPEIRVEIWSGTHPFYTGQQRLVDTEGQVDRFMRRLQKREELLVQEEKEEEKAKPVNLSVEAMSLGTRAVKALQQAEVATVGEALALLERTLPEGREGKQHLAMLGALYQRQGQHRRALGSFERLLTFDPRNASAWAGSGISLEALQEPQRAQQAYQRALSLPGLSPVVRRYAQGRFDALKAK